LLVLLRSKGSGISWALIQPTFPIGMTARVKKIFRRSPAKPIITPKETWEMILAAENAPPRRPPKISPKTFRQKRRLLKLEYQALRKTYPELPPFKEIITAVFEAQQSPLDIFGKTLYPLPEEALSPTLDLLQEIWNYFPRCALNNKSPVEKFTEAKRSRNKTETNP